MSIRDWMLPNSSDARQKFADARAREIQNQDSMLSLQRKVREQAAVDMELQNRENMAKIAARKSAALNKQLTPEVVDMMTSSSVSSDFTAQQNLERANKGVAATQIMSQFNEYTPYNDDIIRNQLLEAGLDDHVKMWEGTEMAKKPALVQAWQLQAAQDRNFIQKDILETKGQQAQFTREEKLQGQRIAQQTEQNQLQRQHEWRMQEARLAAQRRADAAALLGKPVEFDDVVQYEGAQLPARILDIATTSLPNSETFQDDKVASNYAGALATDVARDYKNYLSEYNATPPNQRMPLIPIEDFMRRSVMQSVGSFGTDGKYYSDPNSSSLIKQKNEWIETKAIPALENSPMGVQLMQQVETDPQYMSATVEEQNEVRKKLFQAYGERMWMNPTLRGWTAEEEVRGGTGSGRGFMLDYGINMDKRPVQAKF